MLLAELAEGQRINRAFQMKVQLGLGQAGDEIRGRRIILSMQNLPPGLLLLPE